MYDPNTTYMRGGKVVYGEQLNVAKSINNAVVAMLERKLQEALILKNSSRVQEFNRSSETKGKNEKIV